MKVSVIVFPGSNCDHDVQHAFGAVLGCRVSMVWHRDRDLGDPDLVVLPGGFSYGDYLRTGALAKLSSALQSVREFAARGGPVLGICNGFQILCEAQLLPGVLLQNSSRTFLSRFVRLRVESSESFLSRGVSAGAVVTCPIAHGEGNYYCDGDTLAQLEDRQQVIFRYCSSDGAVNEANRESNPNGSLHAIAGICNAARNVVGLMPHPERAIEPLVGGLGGDSCLPLLRATLG